MRTPLLRVSGTPSKDTPVLGSALGSGSVKLMPRMVKEPTLGMMAICEICTLGAMPLKSSKFTAPLSSMVLPSNAVTASGTS